MSSEPESTRLPFEPVRRKKLTKRSDSAKNGRTDAATAAKNDVGADGAGQLGGRADGATRRDTSNKPHAPKSAPLQETAIPEVVSRRMISRMAVLSGIPTTVGIFSFLIAYAIVSNGLMELPNTAVLLVSLGGFGLGVLGLSYGVLSASWDEEVPGSLLGWSEFTSNFARMRGAWRSARKKNQ
ncbi:MAG TPA: PAM68 family protein [Oscillatoriaceae cyanobacterium M33_DOE_052]|uniref:DUF3464 family protein n=1 Tax=Planktothricoides sp. SpSt-374 TaxID=2282167 RepID=A0A7C3VRQ7_9CYAN|nr:PAM68 family protein [Oscillatoriaceae cyanobacterium M33_DOE_052]